MNDKKFSIRVELEGLDFSVVINNSKLDIDNIRLNKKIIIKRSKIKSLFLNRII